MGGGVKESGIFGICGLVGGEFKCVNPHAVNGFFVVAPANASHGKPSLGNPAHRRFEYCARFQIRGRHKIAEQLLFENRNRRANSGPKRNQPT